MAEAEEEEDPHRLLLLLLGWATDLISARMVAVVAAKAVAKAGVGAKAGPTRNHPRGW